MANHVYKIRNRKTNEWSTGYTRFSKLDDKAKVFKTEKSAKRAIQHIIGSLVRPNYYSRWDIQSDDPNTLKQKLAQLDRYDLELVRVEVIHREMDSSSLESSVKNAILYQSIKGKNLRFGMFWDHATSSGYADNIKYIMALPNERGTPRMDIVKEARSNIRNAGVKTRTFREFRGIFGFYNKDQALKARLTIDSTDFLDVDDLRKELFS